MKCLTKYIAGLVDGRGNIQLDKSSKYLRIYLKFLSNKPQFLYTVNESFKEFGYEGLFLNGSVTAGGYQQYVLYFSPKQTKAILSKIRDSLKFKQDQADFILNYVINSRSMTDKQKLAQYNAFRKLKKSKKGRKVTS